MCCLPSSLYEINLCFQNKDYRFHFLFSKLMNDSVPNISDLDQTKLSISLVFIKKLSQQGPLTSVQVKKPHNEKGQGSNVQTCS